MLFCAVKKLNEKTKTFQVAISQSNPIFRDIHYETNTYETYTTRHTLRDIHFEYRFKLLLLNLNHSENVINRRPFT